MILILVIAYIASQALLWLPAAITSNQHAFRCFLTAGKDEKHSGDHLNKQQDHIHIHRHVHNHVHMHHDPGHHDNFNRHQHQMEHANSHRGHVQKNTMNMHGAQGPHVIDQHGHHSSLHERAHHKQHTREHTGDRHASENQRHDYHGNHAAKFTPSNSPRRYSRQSFTHNEPQISQHDPMHHNGSGHRNYGRRHSTIGSFGYSAQQSDTRTRDHELHWDRHQVCQLKGMITDPHYKEQLEVESGGTYPWSGLYAPNNVSIEDINNMKNCRYLRFSKLNLMNMKENPEEEVEVFEKNQLPE